MEVAKFVFACVSIALTIFGVIAGLWQGYNRKVVARITGIEKDAQEKMLKKRALILPLRVDYGAKIKYRFIKTRA